MLSRRALVFAPTFRALRGQQGKSDMFGNAEAYERLWAAGAGWSRRLSSISCRRAAKRGCSTSAREPAPWRSPSSTAIPGRASSASTPRASTSLMPRAATRSEVAPPSRRATRGDAFRRSRVRRRPLLARLELHPRPQKGASRTRRVVEPGGTVAARHVWDYGDRMRMLRSLLGRRGSVVRPLRRKKGREKMPLCRSGELASLWRECGFGEVHEQSVEVETRFPLLCGLLGRLPTRPGTRRILCRRSVPRPEAGLGSGD